MRTVAIGDIHGCSKALRGLIDAIAPEADDRLVFLGDYVDRGPDARGVVEYLLELKERCNTLFLLGNHEIMFRGALRGLDPSLWLQIGGQTTLTSYGGRLENVPESHRQFFDECLPYFETEEHIFVHANYDPELPLSEQTEHSLYWEHLSDRMPEPHSSGKPVFVGHTPQAYGRISSLGHLVCLDTACFAGYWLSGMDVHSGETWQVSKLGHLREDWRIAKRALRWIRRKK